MIMKRIWWRLLRLLRMNKFSWDKQFEAGAWCRGPQSYETLARVTELCRGGKIIEFGCGEGILPSLLPLGAYSSYQGYDISDVAIQRAKQRAIDDDIKNVQFEQGDMAQWTGKQNASLILIEECLYYLTANECEQFLLQCSECINPDGFILVIVHSSIKHKNTLSICRRVCEVHEESQLGGRTYLTLASKNVLKG